MLTVFDYIFYRVANFFLKKDGPGAIRAILIVSITQCILTGALLFTILRQIYSLSTTAKYPEESKLTGIIVVFIFMIFNYLRYKNKYDLFDNKWGAETDDMYNTKGIAVIVGLLIPWVLLFWMGTSAYRQ